MKTTTWTGMTRRRRTGARTMLPLFIARRLWASQGTGRRVSRIAVDIATAGVAIGLAVMVISVSIIMGYKHTVREKVAGFGSDIQVANFMTLQTAEIYPIQMGDSMTRLLKAVPGVSHVQRFALKQGVLKTNDDYLGVIFKGVGPEFDSTFIHQNMTEGCIPRFSDKKSTGQILLSRSIADRLRTGTGQRIWAYFIDHQGLRARRFTVAGIYQTHLSQYDDVTCFTDLATAVKLNGWEADQASGAELTVGDEDKTRATERILTEKVNRTVDRYGQTYASQTLRELNPQIFSWLDLLDLNVWVILALMTAVAGVTMVSGLLIIILERTTLIAILKALGARSATIRHIFLWLATFIIGRGLLLGDALALGLLLLQLSTGLVRLDPATYYVNTVPVELNAPVIITLNAATLLVCVLVLVAPSYLVARIHPAKSMRYE